MTRTAAALGALALFLGALTATPAVAQRGCPPDHVGCDTQDVDFSHRAALFDAIMIDTGWVPAGAPIQVRFGLIVAGETAVDLGGTAVTAWPEALSVAVPGRADAGYFSVDYGFELIARLRFDVEFGGIRYRWEGDLPTGPVPTDLRVADALVFDPFVLPGSSPRPVTVFDETQEITVYEVPITGGLVSIPGFGGGFQVTARAALEGSYRTDSIEISDAPALIEIEDAFTVVTPDPGTDLFGAAKDYEVLPRGRIGYDGEVILRPSVYLELGGSRRELLAFDLPIPLVDTDADTEFEPAAVHAPLPDIVVPTALVFDATPVGETAERLLTIENAGESELVITASDPSAPFALNRLEARVPPRSTARLAVTLTPTSVESTSGVIFLQTNDPDAPLVEVALRGVGVPSNDGGAPPDAGLADGSLSGVRMGAGCACRAGRAPTSPGAGWLALLGLAAVLRRRR